MIDLYGIRRSLRAGAFTKLLTVSFVSLKTFPMTGTVQTHRLALPADRMER